MDVKSGLWRYYRTVGHICSPTPFAVEQRGKDFFITVSLGNCFNIYNADKLALRFISRVSPEPITHIVAHNELAITAHDNVLRLWYRGRPVSDLELPSRITWMELVGETLCTVSADFGFRMFTVVGRSRRAPTGLTMAGECTLLAAGASTAPITCVSHPQTYINKFLVGRADGAVELWNVRKGKLIYDFSETVAAAAAGVGGSDAGAQLLDLNATAAEAAAERASRSPATALATGPALDVAAVGLASGAIVLLNLRFDVVLSTLAESAPVTSLAFASAARPLLAAGTSSGSISLWDLARTRLQWVDEHAHGTTVAGCDDYHPASGLSGVTVRWQPGEDLFVTAAGDNALRVYVCDQTDGSARVLRARSGHASTPASLLWFGEPERHLVLSAGADRSVRVFNTILARQSRELSQGKGLEKRARRLAGSGVLDSGANVAAELKLPAVVGPACLSANDLRENQWANALTAHPSGAVGVWNTQSMALAATLTSSAAENRGGTRAVQNATAAAASPAAGTAACVSSCGHFGFVGSGDGSIDCFTMQSLRKVDTFPALEAGAAAGAPIFLSTTAMGDRLISVWGGDGRVRVHALPEGPADKRGMAVVAEIAPAVAKGASTEVGALVAAFDPATDLLAVCYSDLSVGVVDVAGGRVARRALIDALPAPPAAMCVLPEAGGAGLGVSAGGSGSLLLVCTPAVLITADVLGGRVVDVLEFPADRPATALAVAPDGTQVVTAHAGTPALALWASRAVYEGADLLAGEGLAAWGWGDNAAAAQTDDLVGNEPASEMGAALQSAGVPVPLGADAGPTLSGLPPSRWAMLPHLDSVQARMAATDAPEAPARTPFFLTQLSLDTGAAERDHLATTAKEADVTGLTAAADAEADAAAAAAAGPAAALRAAAERAAGGPSPAAALAKAADAPAAALAVWMALPATAADREIRLLDVPSDLRPDALAAEAAALADEEAGGAGPARRRRRGPARPTATVAHMLDLVLFCLREGVCADLAGAWALVTLRHHGTAVARAVGGRDRLQALHSALLAARVAIEEPIFQTLGALDFADTL